MKLLRLVPLLAILAAPGCLAQPAVTLKPGDPAPDFTLPGSDGKQYSLAELRGQAVVLCWFPRAGSEGAKNQCASLQSVMASMPADKLQVFGCSTAALDATVAFGQQGKYSFPVLSDANRTAAQAYGCLRADGVSERWIFLIDANGTIQAINRGTSPQTQGADVLKMLKDSGLLAAEPAAAADPAQQLVAGACFTVKFPDMPPTLHQLMTQEVVEPAMTIFLPRNYDPARQHPLLIFLSGGDGGVANDPGVARALSEEQDFVCVALPLFKENLDPNDPDNTPPLTIIRDADGKCAWPLYKTMLAKLEALVPNLDPTRRVLGGFSNGAHMVGEMIDQSDGGIARQFSAFFLIEGGGRTQHFDLISGKPLLLMGGSVASLARIQEICAAATAAGVKATIHEMPGVGHAFPTGEYPAVREWLRGPGMQ